MTSGYVYDSAKSAEAAFKGENTRYIYSRYANPTVTMSAAPVSSLIFYPIMRVSSAFCTQVWTIIRSTSWQTAKWTQVVPW